MNVFKRIMIAVLGTTVSAAGLGATSIVPQPAMMKETGEVLRFPSGKLKVYSSEKELKQRQKYSAYRQKTADYLKRRRGDQIGDDRHQHPVFCKHLPDADT